MLDLIRSPPFSPAALPLVTGHSCLPSRPAWRFFSSVGSVRPRRYIASEGRTKEGRDGLGHV